MRKILIFIIVLFSCFSVFSQTPSHQLTVKLLQPVKGYLYLGNYYGKQTFILDSVQINEKSSVTFSKETPYPSGIYFILFPDKKRHYEFLIDREPAISIQIDTTQKEKPLAFEHSEMNNVYQNYLAFLNREREKMTADETPDNNKKLQEEVEAYRGNIIREHPGTLLSAMLKVMQNTPVPASLKEKGDSKETFYYVRNHYWDAINFKDSSLVRSPLLVMKLEQYFRQMVPPVPDSINKEADLLLQKAKQNKENFKLMLWWLTSHYERSDNMGMDAVFVHLANHYYAKGDAYWINQDQLTDILSKAALLAPNLIGNKAPDITLKTIDLKPLKLSGIQARYTVLVFWDPTCSHCKVIVPEINKIYHESWEKMGVKVVGILADGTEEQWKDFIKDKDLTDWIHLWDPDNSSGFRQLYDVYSTPVIYLLNKDKVIKAKKLSWENTDKVLKQLEKEGE